MLSVFKRFVKVIAMVLFPIAFRIRVSGKENVPQNGAFLMCANHNAMLDMFFIGIRIKRWIYYMAKEELFKNFLMAAILKGLGVFPVKRGKGDIGSIKATFRILKDGHAVGMFVQGTRTKGKQNIKIKAKPGAAMIALKSDVPILPVAVYGDYKLFGKIRVVFGKPYKIPADTDKKYTSDELTQISQGILDKIYALMEEK